MGLFDIRGSAVLYLVGLLSLTYVVVLCARLLYRFFTIHFTPAAVDFRSFGKWALVTGSTDGIGKGIATELARLGIDIVLVSRNPDKLKQVASELESEFQIETRCVVFDFSLEDNTPTTGVTSSVYDAIEEATMDLEVGILVNNVGKAAENLGEYLKCFGSPEELAQGSTDLVNCNMTSMSKVTQIVLQQMIKRRKGLVINLSSIAASNVCTTFSLYAASKRFNHTFSKALADEYKKDGIIIQSIKPGRVATNLTQAKRKKTPGIFFPHYFEYAKDLMKTIGKGKQTTGYWYHYLMNRFVEAAPEKWLARSLMKRCE